MDKLELDCDDLKVESFETASEKEDEGGTVRANDHTYHDDTCEDPDYTDHCIFAPAC